LEALAVARRAYVYVDGFNLYYGLVKGTPYKWLDIRSMVAQLIPPDMTIDKIRYFAAAVSARPSDQDIHVRQQTYLRALRTTPNLEIHLGTCLQSRARMMRPDLSGTVEVFKTEEKGSDVNLATYLIVDAFDDVFDSAVVVTDDSDFVTPILAVRKRFSKQVRVLSPRGRSRRLSQAATRFAAIPISAVQQSQFPPIMVDTHGTFHKPASW
jgi:uncharacterized LabA/DUF88 family protein